MVAIGTDIGTEELAHLEIVTTIIVLILDSGERRPGQE